MSDDKNSMSAFQDDNFLTLINHTIARTTDTDTPNEAIAILVSLGELCPKMALALKMLAPLTARQMAVFEFLQSISTYTKRAESRTDDPLHLLRDLRLSAINARDNFVSSPATR
ncbi:MAG: hypothetical protein WCC59_18980 [Terriglobales bacterium]